MLFLAGIFAAFGDTFGLFPNRGGERRIRSGFSVRNIGRFSL